MSELLHSIVDYLRNNLVDPANRTEDWIYIVFPSIPASYPIVTVSMRESRITVQFFSDRVLTEMVYDIDIYCTDEIFTIDAEQYGGIKLVHYLYERIRELLTSSEARETLQIVNIDIPHCATPVYEADLQVYRTTMRVACWKEL